MTTLQHVTVDGSIHYRVPDGRQFLADGHGLGFIARTMSVDGETVTREDLPAPREVAFHDFLAEALDAEVDAEGEALQLEDLFADLF